MKELIKMEPDSIAALQRNDLFIYPKVDDGRFIMPEIFIVQSVQKLPFPLSSFMGLSIESKVNSYTEDMPLIGYSDVDSISFAGYPALDVEFAYKGEGNDTVCQYQIIVQKPDYSLYYLNIRCNQAYPEGFDFGKKILSTFKFKD